MSLFDQLPPAARQQLLARAGDMLATMEALIVEFDGALAEQNVARIALIDSEAELAILEASATLWAPGSTIEARAVAAALSLRDDPAYQQFAQTSRQARAAIQDTERRLAVLRERLALLRATLAFMTDASNRAR
jgi:hypothetical protein